MQPFLKAELDGNFTMALEAAESRGLGRNLVALDAVGGSIQILVCTRERPGRDLRIGD